MTNQPTPRLVPDWVEIVSDTKWQCDDGDGLFLVLDDGDGYTQLVFGDTDGLECSGLYMSPSGVASILPALAFFAENGRLPTPDDQPKEAQGDA